MKLCKDCIHAERGASPEDSVCMYHIKYKKSFVSGRRISYGEGNYCYFERDYGPLTAWMRNKCGEGARFFRSKAEFLNTKVEE